MKRRGFTLVELLVVIGIIAVLISILLPALSRVREQGNRIKCAANMRTLGQVCTMFANDHKGYYPAAWGYGQLSSQNNAVSLPVLLNYNQANDDDVNTWRRYGSSYQGLLKYAPAGQGVDVSFFDPNPAGYVKLAYWLTCPTALSNAGTGYQAWINNGGYGYAIQTSYVYVAGIPARKVNTTFSPHPVITNVSGYNWGRRAPAVKMSEKGPTGVLATDTVWWGGGGAQGNGYQINHFDPANPTRPKFQNILYADGHVEGGEPGYTDPVTGVTSSKLTANSWSLAHADSGPYQGHYFYWGR